MVSKLEPGMILPHVDGRRFYKIESIDTSKKRPYKLRECDKDGNPKKFCMSYTLEGVLKDVQL